MTFFAAYESSKPGGNRVSRGRMRRESDRIPTGPAHAAEKDGAQALCGRRVEVTETRWPPSIGRPCPVCEDEVEAAGD